MMITYPPEPLQHSDTLYRLAPDGEEQGLCDADAARRQFWTRKERRLYQIIEGHMYYPAIDGPPDIWRTPRTHRNGQEIAA